MGQAVTDVSKLSQSLILRQFNTKLLNGPSGQEVKIKYQYRPNFVQNRLLIFCFLTVAYIGAD